MDRISGMDRIIEATIRWRMVTASVGAVEAGYGTFQLTGNFSASSAFGLAVWCFLVLIASTVSK